MKLPLRRMPFAWARRWLEVLVDDEEEEEEEGHTWSKSSGSMKDVFQSLYEVSRCFHEDWVVWERHDGGFLFLSW